MTRRVFVESHRAQDRQAQRELSRGRLFDDDAGARRGGGRYLHPTFIGRVLPGVAPAGVAGLDLHIERVGLLDNFVTLQVAVLRLVREHVDAVEAVQLELELDGGRIDGPIALVRVDTRLRGNVRVVDRDLDCEA